ncbi:MAG: carboxypeptidase regulatory-like domain-containing protein, partial [Candidatus Cloacimonetes bacterium]|nr:carboxypeptidase regulatory-like domain-containing protein [Candidatus Cloacimonadota bacterium]
MKKLLVLVVLTVFIATLYADLMVPTGKTPLNIESFKRTIKVHTSVSREAPEYEFVTDPVNLVTNFYDYMPGSYNSTPVRVQPDDEGGGTYITFHARENAYSTRRVYYAYIESDGSLFGCETIGTDDLYEGYSGIDIDPVTGDPFVVWHVNVVPATVDLEVVGTYDLFHVMVTPGLWRTPFIIIEDSTPSPNAPNDEFIWPYVHIGPSPDPDKRRVYVVGNNSFSPGSPSENILIGYADFNVDDFNALSTLDWTYRTIPLLDEWNQSIPEWIRPFHSFDVSKTDGKVALFGYNSNDEIYVFLNDNYGEGTFEFIPLNYQFDVWNPQNLDGSYYFENQGIPYTLYWSFICSHHMNSIFTDGTNKLNFSGSFGLQCYEGFYWPFWLYPKALQYDLNTQEFSFHDLYITGANPDDNIPMVPWDLDEDGVVDSWDPQGNVVSVHGWPIYFWATDVAFQENNMKIASNEDNGWLVNIWQDGLKSKYYNDWGDPDYIDWAEIAEVMISISSDGGATWSEPIIMNSLVGDENYVTQLDGMHPCYLYPGDEIEDLGDGWGLIHLFFLDDYSYGSWLHGYGMNSGGMMEYASIKINFGPPIIPGYIEGTVTLIGGTGNVEDVLVTAGNTSTNPTASGFYSIEINPGTYVVTASIEYYETAYVYDVIVEEGQTTSGIDLTLTYIPPTFDPPQNVTVDEETGTVSWDSPVIQDIIASRLSSEQYT